MRRSVHLRSVKDSVSWSYFLIPSSRHQFTKKQWHARVLICTARLILAESQLCPVLWKFWNGICLLSPGPHAILFVSRFTFGPLIKCPLCCRSFTQRRFRVLFSLLWEHAIPDCVCECTAAAICPLWEISGNCLGMKCVSSEITIGTGHRYGHLPLAMLLNSDNLKFWHRIDLMEPTDGELPGSFTEMPLIDRITPTVIPALQVSPLRL